MAPGLLDASSRPAIVHPSRSPTSLVLLFNVSIKIDLMVCQGCPLLSSFGVCEIPLSRGSVHESLAVRVCVPSGARTTPGIELSRDTHDTTRPLMISILHAKACLPEYCVPCLVCA